MLRICLLYTSIIDEKKIEAVLVAGDVYDKPVPSAEAVTVLNSFLNSLAKRNLKVFVISGNHDSQERIGFGAELISRSGVYMSKPFSGNVETHKIKDEYGEINIYMLPFIKPAMVKHVYAVSYTHLDIHMASLWRWHRLIKSGGF